jgi:hypothetical protein
MALKFPTWLSAWMAAHSLVTEIVGGLVLAGAVAGLLALAGAQPSLVVLILASAGSYLYETKLDPSGWSWKDVGQRELGIIAVVIAVRLIVGR